MGFTKDKLAYVQLGLVIGGLVLCAWTADFHCDPVHDAETDRDRLQEEGRLNALSDYYQQFHDKVDREHKEYERSMTDHINSRSDERLAWIEERRQERERDNELYSREKDNDQPSIQDSQGMRD